MQRDEWLRMRERGSFLLLRLMAAFSLRCGRRGSRWILPLVTGYFFAFSPRARRASRAYLRLCLGREPRLRERFRHLFYFAVTIHDRVFFANGRDELFDLSIEGGEWMRARHGKSRGAILLGAHFGSFEVVGAVGRRVPEIRVAMATYEENAGKIRALLSAVAAEAPSVVPLGRIDSMLRIAERIDGGEFVGLLGDRSFGSEIRQNVALLGRPATLPTGPMRIAAMLECPVIFMAALYRGSNRYHVVFQPIADFADVPRSGRAAAIHAAVERYAAILETHLRRDPYNWFNFYPFWEAPGAAPMR